MSEVDVIEVIAGYLFLVLGFITLIIVPRYIFKQWNRLGEKLKPSDRLGTILKALCVSMFGLTILIGAMLRNFWETGSCLQTLLLMIFSWKVAIAIQYLTYVLHLYQCYPKSVTEGGFGYPKKTLWVIADFVIIALIAFVIINIYMIATMGEIDTDNDGVFPFKCQYILDPVKMPYWVYPIGAAMIFWDVLLSGGTIYFFRRAFDRAKQHQSDNPYHKRALRTGFKYNIIVCVSSLTTAIWIIVVIAAGPDAAGIFAGIDFFVSMVCIILMTPDYHNDTWFKFLCCLCIAVEKDIQQKEKPNDPETELVSSQTS